MNTRIVQYQMATQVMTPMTRADVHQIDYHGMINWAVALTQEIDQAIVPASQLQSPALLDMVSIQTTNALGSTLGSLEIKEAVGRVILIACERAAVRRDPVIPVVIMSLGRKYDRVYHDYVYHLTMYHDGDDWWPKARRLCDKTLDALAKVIGKLTRTELAYLVLKLQAPLAFPTGYKEITPTQRESQD